MRNEKTKLKEKKLTVAIDEQATEKNASLKKNEKNRKADETPTALPKVKKSKSEKAPQETVVPKVQKASKDDKMTKFLVSMKKSVRKNIKKEAAEAGVSMNEYIVFAVEERLKRGGGGAR